MASFYETDHAWREGFGEENYKDWRVWEKLPKRGALNLYFE